MNWPPATLCEKVHDTFPEAIVGQAMKMSLLDILNNRTVRQNTYTEEKVHRGYLVPVPNPIHPTSATRVLVRLKVITAEVSLDTICKLKGASRTACPRRAVELLNRVVTFCDTRDCARA